jgi:hypothetical protein
VHVVGETDMIECEICGKEKEYFGCRFQIRNKKKCKDSFYICSRHTPFSKFTIRKIKVTIWMDRKCTICGAPCHTRRCRACYVRKQRHNKKIQKKQLEAKWN